MVKQCEFCKNHFKTHSYLKKHQLNSKYCIDIQNKLKIKEVLFTVESDDDSFTTIIISDYEEVNFRDIKFEDKTEYKSTTEDDIILEKIKNKLNLKCKDNIIDKTFYHLKLVLSNESITSLNILYIIIDLIKFVNHYEMHKSVKKVIILEILQSFIENNCTILNAPFIYNIMNVFTDMLIENKNLL